MHGKKSTIEALTNFLLKDLKSKKPKQKRAKPEKLVEKSCTEWMRSLGWLVEIYEARASFNPYVGKWVSQSMKKGTCDCMGVMPNGVAVAIEFKAKGNLSNFNSKHNEAQREFIRNRIEQNAFACVVDSVERLKQIYESWNLLETLEKKKEFLLQNMPRRDKNKNRFRPPPLRDFK